MEYLKTSCILHPDTEINREILVADLGNIGYESFTETPECLEAYIIASDFSEEALLHLSPFEFQNFRVSFTHEIIPDQNWNEVWEKNYFQPLVIANRCVIRAPFHVNYPTAEYEVVIEPNMAFGTGNHETTILMISEILNQNLFGKTVLDMGCGTGILSILTAKKRAAKVIGIDIDQWAINSSVENVAINKISNLEIIQGGAEVIPAMKFDYIYANIQRNILLNDMHLYSKALEKDGELIVSGFYLADLGAIKARADELGMRFLRFSEIDKWVAAVFTWK